MEVINSSNDVVPNSVASSDVNNNNNHSSSTNANDNNTTNNIEHLKMLLENKQREAEDLAFSINLLETETAYRIQVAEKEKEREVNAAQTNLNFKEQQLNRSEQARKTLERSCRLMQEENQRLKEMLQSSSSNSKVTSNVSDDISGSSRKRARKENNNQSSSIHGEWPSHMKNKIVKTSSSQSKHNNNKKNTLEHRGSYPLMNSPSSHTLSNQKDKYALTNGRLTGPDLSIEELYGPILSIFAETSADLLVLLGVVHLVPNDNINKSSSNNNNNNDNIQQNQNINMQQNNNNSNKNNNNNNNNSNKNNVANSNHQKSSVKLNQRRKSSLFNSVVKTPAQEYALTFANNNNSITNNNNNNSNNRFRSNIKSKNNVNGNNTFKFTPSIMKPSPFSILRTSAMYNNTDENARQEPYLVNLSFQLYTHLTRVIAGRETPVSLIPKILPFVDVDNSRIEYHSAALGVLHRLLCKTPLGTISPPTPISKGQNKSDKNSNRPPITGQSGANTLTTSNTMNDGRVINGGSSTGRKNSNNKKDQMEFDNQHMNMSHPRIHGIDITNQFAMQYERKYNTSINHVNNNNNKDNNNNTMIVKINEYKTVENVVNSMFDCINCFYADVVNMNNNNNIQQQESTGNHNKKKKIKKKKKKRNNTASITTTNTTIVNTTANNNNNNNNNILKTTKKYSMYPQNRSVFHAVVMNEYHRRLERCIQVVHNIAYSSPNEAISNLFQKFVNEDILVNVLSDQTIHIRSKQLLLSTIQKIISIYPLKSNEPLLKLIQNACSIFLHIPLTKSKSKRFQLPLILGALRIISAVISHHEQVGITLLLFSPGRKAENIFILLVNLIEILSSPLKTYENELEPFTLIVIREGLVLLTVFLTFIFSENDDNLDIGDAFGKLTLDGLWLIQDRILKYGNENGTICNRDILSATVQSAETLRSILSHD